MDLQQAIEAQRRLGELARDTRLTYVSGTVLRYELDVDGGMLVVRGDRQDTLVRVPGCAAKQLRYRLWRDTRVALFAADLSGLSAQAIYFYAASGAELDHVWDHERDHGPLHAPARATREARRRRFSETLTQPGFDRATLPPSSGPNAGPTRSNPEPPEINFMEGSTYRITYRDGDNRRSMTGMYLGRHRWRPRRPVDGRQTMTIAPRRIVKYALAGGTPGLLQKITGETHA